MFKKTAIAIGAIAMAMAASSALAARGDDGQLKILYWQAPSILNPYLSGGTKDQLASSIVIEPLAHYDYDGNIVPTLVDEVPTVANGGVSKDLKSITWKLKKGIVWSDGTPLTAADVEFTAAYCMDPNGGCNAIAHFQDVASVKALDAQTVKVTFKVAKPFPYGPFVGAEVPIIQKAQFKDCMGAKAPTCTEKNFNPIGTGPFKVKEFRANDVVLYVANDKYRVAGEPHFGSILLKGGGDAVSAARAVLETGEFDYGWNLQVEPEILKKMEAAGKGKVLSSFGTSVERLMVQLTNPDPKLGDKRAVYMNGKNKHPFLSDPAVRRALSMAIDRQVLVDAGYGAAGRVTCNVLPAPKIYASTANDWCKKQDIAGANKLLDKAGWKRGSDGIRAKNGVKLSILFQTSTNSVRQGTQALIKQMWKQIGVATELKNISASVFFGGDQSSPDTYQKFFSDIEMYTNNFNGTDPENYMSRWTCDKMPGPKNQWIGTNMPRYCDPKYDALVAKLSKTGALEERAKIAKKLNDMLIDYGAMIPLIHRGAVVAKSLSLAVAAPNVWDSDNWNIATWHRAK